MAIERVSRIESSISLTHDEDGQCPYCTRRTERSKKRHSQLEPRKHLVEPLPVHVQKFLLDTLLHTPARIAPLRGPITSLPAHNAGEAFRRPFMTQLRAIALHTILPLSLGLVSSGAMVVGHPSTPNTPSVLFGSSQSQLFLALPLFLLPSLELLQPIPHRLRTADDFDHPCPQMKAQAPDIDLRLLDGQCARLCSLCRNKSPLSLPRVMLNDGGGGRRSCE